MDSATGSFHVQEGYVHQDCRTAFAHIGSGALQEFAAVLARAILRSAFVEHDSNVQSAMWYPLLLFLKGQSISNLRRRFLMCRAEFPESWELEIKANQEDLEDESEDEEVTEPSSKAVAMPSLAYREFLQFLQNGCSGSPIQGYPTVVVILSTISSSVRQAWYPCYCL